MTFVLGMITGALVLTVCCCAVLSGNLSREEEQRTVGVAPVIRCKDCIKRRTPLCPYHLAKFTVISDYDYCSRAKGREEWMNIGQST